MQILQGALLRVLPWVPRSVVRRLAGRYIAGETLDDLLRVVTELHGEGFLTTVDVLGENVTTEEAARGGMEEYLRAVERLAGAGLPSQVSVKLTLLGLRLGEDLARGLLAKITERAEGRGISVCIDMEDSSTTDAILRVFRDARERHSSVSVAIQAYLHRSEKDILGLLPLRPAIRVCKGIYNEPPGIAYQGRREIRESFLRLVRLLLDGGGFPAMATHDPWLVDRCLGLLRGRGGTSPAGTSPGQSPEGHEFQMLLGVGEKLRPRIRARGSRIRLYCPYGPDWHAYSLRRLKENPRMVGYILKSFLSPRVLRKGRLG